MIRRWTFIAPHQRRTTGGVLVIEEMASALARGAEVTLAVRRGPVVAVPGVRVVAAPDLTADEVGEAEVIVGGLAQPDPERFLALDAACGAQVLLFMGYGTPGAPAVEQALRRRPSVMAVSEWLVDRARERGCRVGRFRPGLDAALHRQGPPASQRRRMVAMMTHDFDWKGTEDGLVALREVQSRRPDVDVVLAGRGFGELPGHLGILSRESMADVWREAAIVVCPSWEEGLGLSGLEAQACGAALATTDTKGSRDYAEHRRTALVSPPRDPGALAAHVIELLDDPVLRDDLSSLAAEQVVRRFPSWTESAGRFDAAVDELLDVTGAPGGRG